MVNVNKLYAHTAELYCVACLNNIELSFIVKTVLLELVADKS